MAQYGFADPTDRAEVLAAVLDDPTKLGLASAALRDDRELVLAALTQSSQRAKLAGFAYAYASPRLRADHDVAIAALENAHNVDRVDPLLRVPAPLFTDPEFVVRAVGARGLAAFERSRVTPRTRDFVLACALRAVGALEDLPEYADDKAFVLELLTQTRPPSDCVLPSVSPRLRADRDVVLAAVRRGCDLGEAPPELQRDPEILHAWMRSDEPLNGSRLKCVARYLDLTDADRAAALADETSVLSAVTGEDLKWAAPACRASLPIVLQAVLRGGKGALVHADPLRQLDPCVQMCVAEPRDVDAYLRALEVNVAQCDVPLREWYAAEGMVRRPFADAQAALAFLALVRQRGVWRVGEDGAAGARVLARLLTLVSPYEYEVVAAQLDEAVGADGAFCAAAVVAAFEGTKEASDGRVCTEGLVESVKYHLERLAEVADALPTVAQALAARKDASKAMRRDWARRLEGLAAAIHRPGSAFARHTHERAFAADFA